VKSFQQFSIHCGQINSVKRALGGIFLNLMESELRRVQAATATARALNRQV